MAAVAQQALPVSLLSAGGTLRESKRDLSFVSAQSTGVCTHKVARKDCRCKKASCRKTVVPRAAVTTADPKSWAAEALPPSSNFLWDHHWYPVSLVEDLDPTRPTPFQLLGKDLVIWRDSQSIWRVHADKCPHRLAPLSEGRVNEEGLLECPYHGWAFRGDGSCAKIPQAADSGAEAKAVYSPKACVEAYPAVVSQGLLFVWPRAGKWDEALTVKPPELPPQFSDPDFSTVTIQRDLYYGYDTLMENVADPSHIDFAHHAVTGRRDRAKPLPFSIERSGPEGFEGQASSDPAISSYFLAPSAFFSRLDLHPVLPFLGRQDWQLWICSFNVPMAPGKTRSIVCSARNFAQISVPGDRWWQLYPRWLEHLTSNKIYDGDMIVLQGQEKILQQMARVARKGSGQNGRPVVAHGSVNIFKWDSTGGIENGSQPPLTAGDTEGVSTGVSKPVPYGRLTFTPAGADRMVLEFRNWLRKYAGGEPDWDPAVRSDPPAPLPSLYLTRREMLDRMSQHTEKCSSCRAAYRNVKRAFMALLSLGVVTLGLAVVPGDAMARVGIAAIAMGFFGIAAYLKFKLQPQFEFVDYIIADVK